jgi:aspartyl-tRNA(Asn)/glutamyl-tRNA(Gln) amidotransferase subunit A
LTKSCLSRIERLNPLLNAFITVTADSALSHASAADVELSRGRRRGPLHGIPVGLKDIIDTAGVRTTAASALFKDRVPDKDAEVVRRLKSAGAVLLGKLNLHEFAYGGTSLTSYFGAVRNPWKPDHIAGGSSGGSAAAVAAGLCFGALGTDTGGSIRLPAAYCGIVGLKPTYGHVSTRGVLPLAWSLDHVGPMTRTVADAEAVLRAIAGYDPEDVTSAQARVSELAAGSRPSVSALRVGVPREYWADLDKDIESAANAAVSHLAGLIKEIRDVAFPVAAGDRTAIRAAEAFAYHSPYIAKDAGLYQPEVLARIRRGADISAPAYIESRRRMDHLRRTPHRVFTEVDLLVMPTVPVPPVSISEPAGEDDVRIRNVAPFNLHGLPAISLPCGFTKSGLPIGLQLVGPPWGEELLVMAAKKYEQTTDWHARRPSL